MLSNLSVKHCLSLFLLLRFILKLYYATSTIRSEGRPIVFESWKFPLMIGDGPRISAGPGDEQQLREIENVDHFSKFSPFTGEIPRKFIFLRRSQRAKFSAHSLLAKATDQQ